MLTDQLAIRYSAFVRHKMKKNEVK